MYLKLTWPSFNLIKGRIAQLGRRPEFMYLQRGSDAIGGAERPPCDLRFVRCSVIGRFLWQVRQSSIATTENTLTDSLPRWRSYRHAWIPSLQIVKAQTKGYNTEVKIVDKVRNRVRVKDSQYKRKKISRN